MGWCGCELVQLVRMMYGYLFRSRCVRSSAADTDSTYTVFRRLLTGASAYPVEASSPPTNMCTLSWRISFSALRTPTGGLPSSSSTMKVTLAPARSPLCWSRYSWKPFSMSLPICAKMPVSGATKPMRSSSAAAGVAVPATAKAQAKPVSFLVKVIAPPLGCTPPPPDSGRDAHQAARQIQDRQHVDRAEHVLPPRHDRGEILAQ